MQYQRNKFEEKKKKHRKSRSPDNIDSDLGEMNYADPNGNQYISSNAQVEQNIDINEQQTIPVQPSLQGTINQIKNELKNRMELAQIMKENPIESLEVNIPRLEPKSKSPKTINIGDTKEDIEYNIRTLNHRRSPGNFRNRQNMPSSDNLSGTDAPYQAGGEVQIQGLPDYRNQRQISFNPKGIILRSPNAPKRFKEFVYMPNDRSEENIRSPSNQMSPNMNYEEMNNSGTGSRKGEELETKNYQRTNTGNIFASKINQQRKPTSGKQKILTNLSASSMEEIQDKYKKSLNNNTNMNIGEVKKIMRRFTKIYDPNKNNNGALLGSTQVTLPGEQDEVFNSRYRVLAKMNRLSNILLSNRNRSPTIGTYNRASLLNRSRSRSLSRESLDKSIRERSVKKPRNKFLYVSLAMLSSKGPSAQDRIILRKMRMEKGGVVDLAQEQRKKPKYRIRQVVKNVRQNSFYHMNPKYREKAAKIIQDWWRELKIVTSDRLKKIILIQSVYRGKWIRKNMYDLLYLNYLYICFCKKIEKVLLSNLRPYVFEKLFYTEKKKKKLLTDIIQRKEENILRPYWNYWLKAIKSQHLINEASRKLLQIRSNKENKLSILLAFFNKWKYICRIGLPKDYDYDKDKDGLSPDYNKVMPTGKLKCLVNILDATNKYTKQKAMDKILNKVMKYLTIQAKKTKLLKLLAKKPIYVKILLRKKLYFWYRQMVNSKHSFSSEDKLKVYEMKQKIFSLTFTSTIKSVYRRIKREYFRKLIISNIPIISDKKYKSIYELIKDKLSNNSDFEEGAEETYEIDGKITTVIKKKKDLIVIDDKGEKSKLENYKEVVTKKRYPLVKKDALILKKDNEPESGNEPYEESEEQQEVEDQRKKVIKKKRPSSEISGKEMKRRKKVEKEEIKSNEEEEEGSERRSRFGVVEEKIKKKKPKKGIIEEIYTKKKEGKIIETRTKKKIPSEEEEEDEFTEKVVKEEDSDGIVRKKIIKVPKKKKPKNKYLPQEEDENEEIEYSGKPKQISKKSRTKGDKGRESEEGSNEEVDYATMAKRPKTIPKKPTKKKYTNKNGEIVEEDEEPSEEVEEIQKYEKGRKKPKTVDKKGKPKKVKKIYDENGEEIEVEETPSESDEIQRPVGRKIDKKEKIHKKKTKPGEEIEVEEEEYNEKIDRGKTKGTDKPKKKKYITEEKETEENIRKKEPIEEIDRKKKKKIKKTKPKEEEEIEEESGEADTGIKKQHKKKIYK